MALVADPEDWEDALSDFMTCYKPRLRVFLSALQECEEEQIKNGKLQESQRLSRHMEQSMHNGVF